MMDWYVIDINSEKIKAASEELANGMFHSSSINLLVMNALICSFLTKYLLDKTSYYISKGVDSTTIHYISNT